MLSRLVFAQTESPLMPVGWLLLALYVWNRVAKSNRRSWPSKALLLLVIATVGLAGLQAVLRTLPSDPSALLDGLPNPFRVEQRESRPLPPVLPPPSHSGPPTESEAEGLTTEDVATVAHYTAVFEAIGWSAVDLAGPWCSFAQGETFDEAIRLACTELGMSVADDPSMTVDQAVFSLVRRASADGFAMYQAPATPAAYRQQFITQVQSGGSGGRNVSTALGGPCDDGELPPESERDRPLNISTRGLSPAAAEEVQVYARLVNSYLARFGPLTTAYTAGVLRDVAGGLAQVARGAAAELGTPLSPTQQMGHVPDTYLSATADPPCGWMILEAEANSAAGRAFNTVGAGYTVTHVVVDGILPGL